MNMSLLFYALRKKLKVLDLGQLPRDLGILTGAAVLAGLAAWVASWQWSLHIGHRFFWSRAGEVFGPMTLAALVYFGVAAFGGAGHLQELMRVIRQRLARR
jgi:peptidoglycan biosynthesis protein MviN/MurJ (putative lipid II flippase)